MASGIVVILRSGNKANLHIFANNANQCEPEKEANMKEVGV